MQFKLELKAVQMLLINHGSSRLWIKSHLKKGIRVHLPIWRKSETKWTWP